MLTLLHGDEYAAVTPIVMQIELTQDSAQMCLCLTSSVDGMQQQHQSHPLRWALRFDKERVRQGKKKT